MLSLPMTIRAPTTRSAIWQELGGSADRQTIKEAGIPFVLVMRTYPKLTKDAVITDDYQGAYDAVCHLARAGRKRRSANHQRGGDSVCPGDAHLPEAHQRCCHYR